MYIKGLTEYNKQGEEVKSACIFGRATKDGEIRETNSGKQVATVSVKAFGKKDGSAEFVTVKVFGGPFLQAIGNTKKGDAMMACGRMEERTFNDKRFVDMFAEFFLRAPNEEDTEANFAQLQKRVNDFNAIDDDSELPF